MPFLNYKKQAKACACVINHVQ